MKYSTISIKYINHRDEYQVDLFKLDGDMVEEMTTPHSFGFYHFPETESPEVAFKKLREYLIECKQAKIKELQDQIKKLKALEYKEVM